MPFGKRVERPASEENSILSCSYIVVNHQAEMSNVFCYFVNKEVVIRFFLVSAFPQPLSRHLQLASYYISHNASQRRGSPLFAPPDLRMCFNLLILSCWRADVCRESVSARFLFQSRKSLLPLFKDILSCGCVALKLSLVKFLNMPPLRWIGPDMNVNVIANGWCFDS